MKVGIVGLGLIGGSAAKAYKAAGHEVYAYDIESRITGFAALEGTVDAELTAANIAECELLLLTATPKAVVSYIEAMAKYVARHTLVIDFCGTKKGVCEVGFALAREYNLMWHCTQCVALQLFQSSEDICVKQPLVMEATYSFLLHNLLVG